jgi:hypothetical protein
MTKLINLRRPKVNEVELSTTSSITNKKGIQLEVSYHEDILIPKTTAHGGDMFLS